MILKKHGDHSIYADIYCDQCHKFSLAMFDDNYFPDQVVDVLPPEEYK